MASCIFWLAASSAAVLMSTLPCGVVIETPSLPRISARCGVNSAVTAPRINPTTTPAISTTAV